MEVNIDGFKIVVEIEVIEILEDMDPYQDMLGIHRAFDNNVILKLK